jgi:hypothetical protein
MSANNTFREVAIEHSQKQPKMVDQFLEDAPILEMIPFEETSHGLYNVYEELVDVTGAGLVDMDEALPIVDVTTKLDQVSLSVIGGKMFVGEDKARQFGGAGNYFAKKQGSVLRKTGMDLETAMLYNNIRAKAIESGGDHLIDAGGTGSTNYSILAVKWVSGETAGLYDPNGFGKGMLMDVKPLNGGNLSDFSTTTTDGRSVTISGYGIRMKSYVGMQLANARYVSSIVNVDLANDKLPTEAQIDDLIDSVRGQVGGSTWLYMHPKVYTSLFKYKGDSLEIRVSDEIVRSFTTWNGIPIVTSYNFKKGTEAKVTVS